MKKLIKAVLILFLKRNFGLIIVPLLFLLAIIGSQKTNVGSKEWKQQKIETMYHEYAQEFPEVSSINASELQKLQKDNKITIVDVRTPEERAVSIIPGAISQASFEQNIDKYKNQLIVVYCTIGYRSGKYIQKLQEKGLNILNLEGSLLAWSHIGGELVNSSGKTKEVHVFGKKWELTADDYQPVW